MSRNVKNSRRILIVSNMYPSVEKPYSGIFVLNQYNYLKDFDELSVDLFAMKRTFTSAIGSIVKYIKAFFRFIPVLRHRYDVVHVHYFYPFILLAVVYRAFYRGVSIFVTFHGSDINGFMNGRLDRWFFRQIIRRVDVVIAVSDDLSRKIEKKLGRRSDYILSAGVDDRVFYMDGNVEKKFDFIFVGSFIERKGIDILLRAVQIVGDKNVSYCFVGSGPYHDEIGKLQSEFNITILENQTQVQLRNLYNQAKYFILPSRDEPFGLVACESLFCGVPIIVSSCGGLKDQVKDGYNGFMVESDQPETYARIIIKLNGLSDDEYHSLVDGALESNKRHRLSTVCSELVGLYNKGQ